MFSSNVTCTLISGFAIVAEGFSLECDGNNENNID